MGLAQTLPAATLAETLLKAYLRILLEAVTLPLLKQQRVLAMQQSSTPSWYELAEAMVPSLPNEPDMTDVARAPLVPHDVPQASDGAPVPDQQID